MGPNGVGVSLPSPEIGNKSNFLNVVFQIVFRIPDDRQRPARLGGVPVPTAWRVLRFRMEDRLQIWRLAANILNKQSQTDNKGWPSSLGLGVGLTTPHRKKNLVRTIYTSLGPGRILCINDLRYGIRT
jgi:hypothetical protein